MPDAYLVLSYLIATVPINWKYAKNFPALFFCSVSSQLKQNKHKEIISTAINLKNYLPLLKGSDLEKRNRKEAAAT